MERRGQKRTVPDQELGAAGTCILMFAKENTERGGDGAERARDSERELFFQGMSSFSSRKNVLCATACGKRVLKR